MTPLAAAGLGGLAGLAGAVLVHGLALLNLRYGNFGPPYCDLGLATGVLYGAIGAAAGRRSAAVGLLGGFLGMLVPLYVLSRYGAWTPQQWSNIMVAVYVVTIWSTIAGIGAAATSGKPWRGAAAAALGSFAGYAVLSGVIALFRVKHQPLFVDLLDGLLSGAGLCLALSLEARISRRTS